MTPESLLSPDQLPELLVEADPKTGGSRTYATDDLAAAVKKADRDGDGESLACGMETRAANWLVRDMALDGDRRPSHLRPVMDWFPFPACGD